MSKPNKSTVPVVQLTPEQKEARKQAFIQRRLDDGVRRANALLAEFAAKLTKSLNDAEYALRWQQDNYEIVRFGQFCESAITEGLTTMLVAAKLKMKFWSPQNSTNPFSNACNNEEFLAVRKFIETFDALNSEEA